MLLRSNTLYVLHRADDEYSNCIPSTILQDCQNLQAQAGFTQSCRRTDSWESAIKLEVSSFMSGSTLMLHQTTNLLRSSTTKQTRLFQDSHAPKYRLTASANAVESYHATFWTDCILLTFSLTFMSLRIIRAFAGQQIRARIPLPMGVTYFRQVYQSFPVSFIPGALADSGYFPLRKVRTSTDL